MCVENPVPFQSDVPIIAYKVMLYDSETNTIQSMIAGNRYLMGTSNVASEPSSFSKQKISRHFFCISCSNEYEIGFHAYEKKEDAENLCTLYSRCSDSHEIRIIEVEITEITHKGDEWNINLSLFASVYVAQKCRFIRIME